VVGAFIAYLLNEDLFRLLFTKGGARLALGGFLLQQQLYYLYSLFGLAVGFAMYFAGSLLSRNQDQPLKQV